MTPWSLHGHQGLLIPPVLTIKCQSHLSLDNMQTTLTFSFKPGAESPPFAWQDVGQISLLSCFRLFRDAMPQGGLGDDAIIILPA